MHSDFLRAIALIAASLSLSACTTTNSRQRDFCEGAEHPETRMPLEIVLADMALPGAHRLAFTHWKVVANDSPPSGLGVEVDTVIGEGKTGDDGVIRLAPDQQHALAVARCANRPLWLLYPGQTQPLDLQFGQVKGEHCGPTTAKTLCLGYGDDP